MSQQVLKQHGRSFYFASQFMGHEDAAIAARLYALCRQIDDLADETADRHALALLQSAIEQRDITHPMVAEYLSLAPGMPSAPLQQLVAGAISDLGEVAIADLAELLVYAHQVAGTVGQMMCAIYQVSDPRADAHAVALGQAMQMTNIARDVVTDAKMGRRYLPAQWVGELTGPAIVHPHEVDRRRLKSGIEQLLDLADEYYEFGLEGLGYLPPRVALTVEVAARVYREIGMRLRQSGMDVWAGRAVVPQVDKVLIGANCALGWALQNRAGRR